MRAKSFRMDVLQAVNNQAQGISVPALHKSNFPDVKSLKLYGAITQLGEAGLVKRMATRDKDNRNAFIFKITASGKAAAIKAKTQADAPDAEPSNPTVLLAGKKGGKWKVAPTNREHVQDMESTEGLLMAANAVMSEMSRRLRRAEKMRLQLQQLTK